VGFISGKGFGFSEFAGRGWWVPPAFSFFFGVGRGEFASTAN